MDSARLRMNSRGRLCFPMEIRLGFRGLGTRSWLYEGVKGFVRGLRFKDMAFEHPVHCKSQVSF